eukprot:c19628_g1_i3 orf=66-1112(+)
MSSPAAEGVASPRKKKQRLDKSGGVVDEAQVAANNMQRYLVTVEYIGSRYLGFQKQKGQDCRTVQGALEDTGVHALRNVCHVDVERVSKRKPGEILPPHEPGVVKRAVNHFLQRDGEDVQVVDVRCVPRDFHARFEAKERTYHYRIIVSSEALSIFERNRAWHIQGDLHIPAMQQACRYLVGHHDFSSFRASGCQAKSPVKTLDELHICEMPSWLCYPSERERKRCLDESFQDFNEEKVCSTALQVGSSDQCPNSSSNSILKLNTDVVRQTTSEETQGRPHCYVITARARSFLYHQVRLMVGLLKAVGMGEVQLSDVPRILEARTVTEAPPMAPACGLYLANVKYELD